MKSLWFLFLVSAICLEGLGRRYLPWIPSAVFYFSKDVVLLFGLYQFRPGPNVRRAYRYLYRGFGAILAMAIAWTLVEMLNPEHQSMTLAVLGLRAYWLWWIAPPVVAMVLLDPQRKQRAIYVLLAMAVGISILAAVQFAAPPDSSVNMYSVVGGEEVYANIAIVATTGRARVASTFSFLSGFVAFTILVPTLLLSIGLEARTRRLRRLAFGATLATAAVVPMSGSRASVLLGIAVLLITVWTSGLFFTRLGRRVLMGGVAAGVLAVAAFPDAFAGVTDRFSDTQETASRIRNVASVIPPAAILMFEYPMAGVGTGMQQNARISMNIRTEWDGEIENERYLIELGPVGFILVWGAKIGLVVALVRAYRILRRAGRRGSAGAALSYAALTMFGNLTFDHIWQALYFLGCGFILAEVVEVTGSVSRTQGPPPLDRPGDEWPSYGGEQAPAGPLESTMPGQLPVKS